MRNKFRSSNSLFQRAMSAFLACVLILGLVPNSPVSAAASPEDGMPAQIKLASCKYGVGNSKTTVTYQSPNNMGKCYIHVFDMDMGGSQTAGFCTQHEKIMGSKYVGQTWTYMSKEPAGTKPYQPFLDWWEHNYERSVEADAKYPGKTTEEKQKLLPGYWDSWTRSVANAWVQSSVWLGRSNKLNNYHDQSQITMLAKERQASLKRLGYNTTLEDSQALINTIVQQWDANVYGKRDYYEYDAPNSRLQRMLVPRMKTLNLTGYLKLNKVSAGKPLQGAQFVAYKDSSCRAPVVNNPFSTNAAGEAVIKVPITTTPDKTGRATQTFYVKEVKAPIGYAPSNSVYTVSVDSKANATAETAALVNGGTPINNEKTVPVPPEGCTVKKIDKATGEGVGVAWFKFQGTAYDNTPVDICFPTDAAGNLKLQWVDPNDKSAPYILPGEYTVTEDKAPIGYEKDLTPQHVSLTIRKDEHTDTEVPLINGSGVQNGCLIFKNAPMKVIVIDKVDAQTKKPLAGAVFSVSYNGKYICDIESNDAGQAIFDGVDHKGVPTGWYEFTETIAPDGYKIPYEHSQSIYIDCGGQVDEDGNQLPISNEPVHLTFENSLYPEIIIKKTVAETEEPLAGAVFHVTINGHDFGNLGPTGVDGIISLSYDDYGEYLPEGNQECVVTVEEVTAPAGYLLNKTPQTKVLKENQTLLEFTFGNYHYPEVVIEKIDRDTGKPLANAEFNVWINDKQYPNTVKTNAEGKFLFTWNQLKGYLDEQNDHWTVTVQETKAPDGYLINQTAPVKKELYRQTRAPLEFHFENSIYPTIVIEKLDLDSGNKLPGAEFEMQIDGVPFKDGKKLVTGADGTVKITYAEYKNYLDTRKSDWTIAVRETKAPDGFLLNDPSWHTQELVKTQGYVPFVFSFYDSVHPFIRIRKFETGTDHKLGGAQFEVKINGNLINDRITTDASGEAIISWGQYGKFLDDTLDEYTVAVREVVAPKGYLIDNPQWQEIKVKKEQKLISFDFADTAYPELHIKKIDAETGLGLGGARFDVYVDGTKIGNFETLMDGTIDISYEKLKGYLGQDNKSWTIKVVETHAPADYLKNDPSEETREVTAGQMHHPFIFADTKYPTIQIVKEDAVTHRGLEGAEFELWADGKKFPGIVRTDDDGRFLLSYSDFMNFLPNNKDSWEIRVRETKAPDGYLLDSSEWQIKTLYKDAGASGHGSVVFKFVDHKYPELEIIKLDAKNQMYLPGAVFEVEVNGKLLPGEFVTDDTGRILIEWPTVDWLPHTDNVGEWTVRVREIKAPSGYMIDDTQWQTIQIRKDKQHNEIVFEDTKYPSIRIVKLDRETGEPLPNTSFRIVIDGTSFIAEKATDENGQILITYDEYGQFLDKKDQSSNGWTVTVTELEPTDYYNKDKQQTSGDYTQTQQLKYGQDLTPFEFKDTRYRSINVVKRDSNTGEPLEGAVFTLHSTWLEDPRKGTVKREGRTNANGELLFQDLPNGTYILTETIAPEGYEISSSKEQTIQVTSDSDKIIQVEIRNAPKSSIIITKVSSVGDQPLMGAKFLVKAAADGTKIGEFTTDVSGIATTPSLAPGDYLIKEVKAPDGYILNDKEFRVTVKENHAEPLVVVNTPEASLVIFKGDRNTGRGIAGAVFKVETADRDFIGQYTTDAQGEALVRPVKPGHYIVTEMSAPEGYIVSDAPKTITVKAGVVNRVEFTNAEQGSLVIRLEDQADGHKLENGRFQLFWAATGEMVGEGVTDNSGSIVWGNLNPGRYIIKQTYAPDGYTIVDKEKSEVVVSGDTKVVVFKDATAGIVIEKIDRLTKKPLAGARFQLTRNSDNIVIGEYVTGNDGLALVSGLTPGMYTVKELEAPTGYAIDEAMKIIDVKVGTQAHITFANTPFVGITINAVDKDTNKPLSGIVFEVWHQNGSLVNTYTTDSTGIIQTDSLPAGFYVIKVIKTENGMQAVTSEQTIEIKDGIPQTVKFEFIARGILHIYALNNQEQGLPGMKVTVTKQNGEFVGNYTVDKTGLVKVPNLEPGWYLVKETQTPVGYTMSDKDSQSIEITANGNAVVKFYHGKTMCLQVRTSVQQTGEMVPGMQYLITQLDGKVIGTYESDKAGIIYANLNPGWYVIKPLNLPAGYTGYDLPESRNVEIVANKVTVVDFQLSQLSSIRIRFVDGQTNAPIYGVRVLLKNEAGKVLDDYTSNNDGYITLKQSILNGSYTLEQIAVPSGYTVDQIPKSIDVLNGQTTEVVWKMYTQSGQIQVHVTSSAYNSTLDLPAGSNLQGAVFEVINPFTYAVMSTMTSDSYGVAATQGLPIGRYIIREKSPASYFQLSGKQTEVYLKITNDVVRVEYQESPVRLGSGIAMRANKSVTAGTSMKYIFTAVNNNSGARLDNFFWNIKIPTDAMRAGTLYTGKWSAPVFYNISYRTNMNDYRPLARNLSSSNPYQYDLSSLAINVQGGEYVTDIRFEFGTVPAGFKPTVSPVFFGYVMPNVPNGYKVIMRTECGGKYGASWVSGSGLWTTDVVNNGRYSNSYPTRLPKTGY